MKFDQEISDFNFKKIVDDQYIYHKFKESRLKFLVLYMDDILLTSNDMIILLETKSFFSKNFEIKIPGDISFVIGIQIPHDKIRGILGLSQKACIDKGLHRCGMKN